jgi:DNA invertase Pin-like site-specific DNA recombinase
MAIFGYLRVSTNDGRQTTRSQKAALRAAGVKKFHEEHVSGTKAHKERPVLAALMSEVTQGDILWVYDISRLARGLGDLLSIAQVLQDKGVQLRSVQQGIVETGTPTGALMLSILGAIHEFEVSLLREKTRAGVKVAQDAGRFGGRKPSLNADQIVFVRRMRHEGESIASIGKIVGVSRPTIYRALDSGYRVSA